MPGSELRVLCDWPILGKSVKVMAQGQSQRVRFARFGYVELVKERQGEEETRAPGCYGLYDLLSR